MSHKLLHPEAQKSNTQTPQDASRSTCRNKSMACLTTCWNHNCKGTRVTLPFTRYRRFEKPPPEGYIHRRFTANHRRQNHIAPPFNTKSPFHEELPSTNRDLIQETPTPPPRFCWQIWTENFKSTWEKQSHRRREVLEAFTPGIKSRQPPLKKTARPQRQSQSSTKQKVWYRNLKVN